MMTKGDYIKIAEAIAITIKDLSFIDDYQTIIRGTLINNFKCTLKYDNYMFDEIKFGKKIDEFLA